MAQAIIPEAVLKHGLPLKLGKKGDENDDFKIFAQLSMWAQRLHEWDLYIKGFEFLPK